MTEVFVLELPLQVEKYQADILNRRYEQLRQLYNYAQGKLLRQYRYFEQMKEYQAAQGEISSALGRLIAVSEAYPDLKANENFQELQAQLEGTENRINEARRNYNEVAQAYNVKIRQFPTNILAGLFNFGTKEKFAAESAAEKAPTVEF
jgi:hypothetical protein